VVRVLDARVTRPAEGGPSFPLSNQLLRAFWNVAWLILASWTPPQAMMWRRLILRAFGARIAPTARVYGSAKIWLPSNLSMAEFACLGPRVRCYSMDEITLGSHALVSQGAHLCAGTHDVDDPYFQLKTRPIKIGAGAWIAAEAFVGPGVTVGDRAVLGARGVTFKDLEPATVYLGNPAAPIRKRLTSSRRERSQMGNRPVFIAASPGGHLTQLMMMTDKIDHKVLFTYDKYRKFLDKGIVEVIQVRQTRFNPLIHFINATTYLILLIKYRPIILISTGGPFALPLLALNKIAKIPSIYVDTLSRVDGLSATAELVARWRLSTKLLVQWPSLESTEKGTEFHGAVVNLPDGRHTNESI
jgi:putative colanic acid biosynthesis acetyltransferase WcaF